MPKKKKVAEKKVKVMVECRECGGSGEEECGECGKSRGTCTACDGDGEVEE